MNSEDCRHVFSCLSSLQIRSKYSLQHIFSNILPCPTVSREENFHTRSDLTYVTNSRCVTQTVFLRFLTVDVHTDHVQLMHNPNAFPQNLEVSSFQRHLILLQNYFLQLVEFCDITFICFVTNIYGPLHLN